MSWKYGVIKSEKDWFYLGEIYDYGSHTKEDYYKGISGESPEEIVEIVEMILKDLKDNLLVVEEIKWVTQLNTTSV